MKPTNVTKLSPVLVKAEGRIDGEFKGDHFCLYRKLAACIRLFSSSHTYSVQLFNTTGLLFPLTLKNNVNKLKHSQYFFLFYCLSLLLSFTQGRKNISIVHRQLVLCWGINSSSRATDNPSNCPHSTHPHHPSPQDRWVLYCVHLCHRRECWG